MARDSDQDLLLRTSQRIAMAMDVDGVITAYLDQVAARGRYVCTIVLYEFDATGRRARVVIWGTWTPDVGLTLRQEERRPRPPDPLDPLLDAGRTVTISDVQTDPRAPAELRAFQAQAGRPALAMIPLMARQQRIGLVILSAPRVQAWSIADLHPYQLTAAQLASAIDSRRQHRLLAERERQLAVLEDRRRLARELHDSVIQLIFSATLLAESLAPIWPAEPAEAERRLARLMELNRAALAEMRALLVELRGADESTETPPGDEASTPVADASGLAPSLARVRREGLPAALTAHIAGLGDGDFQVALTTDAYVAQPVTTETALFRIAQEALTNVCKHAQARRVAVTLATREGTTTLTVADDGVGFAPPRRTRRPASGQQNGFGLQTMRERAVALGGAVRVVSAPGRGATVTATLPVQAEGDAP